MEELLKNVVNNMDKSSLWAPWQNGPYKNIQNITKHEVYKDATDIKKYIFLVFFGFFWVFFNFNVTLWSQMVYMCPWLLCWWLNATAVFLLFTESCSLSKHLNLIMYNYFHINEHFKSHIPQKWLCWNFINKSNIIFAQLRSRWWF